MDLHSHILPGVDHGAASMEESLEMARQAVHWGFSCMVATSHFHPSESGKQELLESAFRKLTRALEYEQIPLTLLPGMEIMATEDLPLLLEQGEVWTYPDCRSFLVEFPMDAAPEFMQNVLAGCLESGFQPVIAHPERYYALWDIPDIAGDWVEMGCILQINRDSLLGKLGKACLDCANYFARHDWIGCLASDAHGVEFRNANWSDAFLHLPRRYGFSAMEKWLESGPKNILK